MTTGYECKWLISGKSVNKGLFREEGSTWIRRSETELRDEASLREEIIKGIIDGYIEASQPWRTNPKYLGLTDLKVELGEIEVVDENTKRSIESQP